MERAEVHLCTNSLPQTTKHPPLPVFPDLSLVSLRLRTCHMLGGTVLYILSSCCQVSSPSTSSSYSRNWRVRKSSATSDSSYTWGDRMRRMGL